MSFATIINQELGCKFGWDAPPGGGDMLVYFTNLFHCYQNYLFLRIFKKFEIVDWMCLIFVSFTGCENNIMQQKLP